MAPEPFTTGLARTRAHATLGRRSALRRGGRLRVVSLALLLVSLVPSTGCYYGHLAVGQARLLWARRDVADVARDPATPAILRARLALVDEVRRFANGLGLAVDGQYTSYVEWAGDRIVTTVVATRPGEVTPAGFAFPIVGTLPYKGFFASELADREAARLRERGLDTCLAPVAAYSTLGWMADPLTAPMLRRSRTPGELVELLVHELVHATVFATGDARFNEGFATAFAQAAVVAFAEQHPDALGLDDPVAAVDAERVRIAERRRLAALVVELRDAVAALYERRLPADPRARERTRLELQTREQIAALEVTRGDARSLARRVRLNDACLALRGTYAADLPLYAARLAELDGDLGRFLVAARASAREGDPRRAFFGPQATTGGAVAGR